MKLFSSNTVTEILSEYFDKIISQELTGLETGLTVLAIIFTVLLFFPALIGILTWILGTLFKTDGFMGIYEPDSIVAYLLGLLVTIISIYAFSIIIGYISGKFRYVKTKPTLEELKLFNLIHNKLPKLNTTKKEFKLMRMELFLRRKKLIKYVFDNNMDTHIPKGITEELRAISVTLKELAIEQNFQNLTLQEKERYNTYRMLKNKPIQNLESLDPKRITD